MNPRFSRSVLSLLLFAGAVGSVHAMQMDLRGQRDFASQRAAIERDLAEGEKYAELAADDLARVRASLDRMQRLIEAAGAVATMAPDDRVELFNEQETVNQVLTSAAEDSRLVCQRERPTGSMRAVSHCMTVAERRRAREAARDTVRNAARGTSRQGIDD